MIFESNHIFEYSLFRQFEDSLCNELYSYSSFSLLELEYNEEYNKEYNEEYSKYFNQQFREEFTKEINEESNKQINNNNTLIDNLQIDNLQIDNSKKRKRKRIITDSVLNGKPIKILKSKTVPSTSTINSKSFMLTIDTQTIRCLQLKTNEYIYNVIDIMTPLVSHKNNISRDLKNLDLNIEYVKCNKKNKYFKVSEMIKIFNKLRNINYKYIESDRPLKYDQSKINYMNRIEKIVTSNSNCQPTVQHEYNKK
jgi:hypothetical protein